MPVRRVQEGAPIGVARGDVAVVIPVYGAVDDFAQCLASILEHTPAATKIVVADDASPGPQIERHLDNLAATGTMQHDVLYVKRTQNRGFVGNVNGAFEETNPADVVIVNSDVIVGPGWLDGLTHAAQQDPTVATVSTLTNHGTIVSLPRRNSPASALQLGLDAAQAAQRVRENGARAHPRLPTAIGHCMLITRRAIELVGPFDLAFSPGYGEEVDFSQRCVLQGLKHVLADDVFVFHRGQASFQPGAGAHPVQEEHEREIARRYPYYHPWVAGVSEQRGGPFSRALATGRRALSGLSVTIDGTSLNQDVAGTQVQTMEVIRGVHGAGVRPRVVVGPELGDHWRHELERLEGVTLVPIAQATDEPPAAVAHRPFQVTASTQLDFLHRLGERVIVTHQDLIAFQNPGYFENFDGWHAYRAATAKAMAIADTVVFISNHVAAEALAEEMVDERQVRIVPNGTDHATVGEAGEPAPPAGVEAPFMLCLGVDFRHKNRVFAMEVQREMRARGWSGSLVLAGPRAQFGSSMAEERAWLARHPDEPVVVLGAVSEAEKQWLYENTELVLYPTAQEGFGLVPFEAARAGKPCLFAAQTALAEVLPPEAARIVQWNAGLTAENAMKLIEDQAERTQQIESIVAAGERYSWTRTGEQLAAIYEQALAAPMRPARAVIFEGAGDGKPTYPPAVEQALATIAQRPRLRRTVFGSVTALQKGARGLRRLAAQRR